MPVLRAAMQGLMTEKCSVFRNSDGLNRGIDGDSSTGKAIA